MMIHRSGGRHFISKSLVLAFMALGLTSCGRIPMAPVFHGNGHSVNEERGGRAHASGEAYQVRVRNGDTLSEIALRHNVPTRQLARANGIRAPFTIFSGQELTVPASPTHTVRRGESLSVIAERNNLSTRELAQANHIRAPYTIYAGQQLAMPWASPGASTEGRQSPVRRSRWSDRSRAANNSASTRSASPAVRPRTPATRNASADRAAPALRRVSPQPASIASARSLVPPARSDEGFIWPVDGRVISNFGPEDGGRHNDGINIAVPSGTPIRAADAGVVIYEGNQVPGYGSLILIRHESGYVTAYAHNSRIHVRQGQVVDQGERIALSGQSGRVNTPQLHFEVRRNSEAVNPAQFLGGA